jgi:hypothetical protein
MDLWASRFGLGDQGSSPAAPTAAANDGSGLAQAQAVSVTDLAMVLPAYDFFDRAIAR